MEIIVTKTFVKQLKLCPAYIQEGTKLILLSLEKAKELKEVPAVKKLVGHTHYYRIRVGDYRIGIRFEKPDLLIMTILHRGTIYKKFPPSN
jgi:mRNA-degrading endonuclease RelE of RelBE toxin-antitoxin system